MKKIIIIGGGAAGIFAAIRCKEIHPKYKVTVLEASPQILKKVKISGGGRCNVTHHQFDSREFAKNYPRGQKELLSPLNQFQAEDTVKWFEDKGVKIKSEDDGRMFPVTNSSQTIIDCFMGQVKKYQIKILKQKNVKTVKKIGDKFSLWVNKDEEFLCDSLMIATGSMPSGYKLAKQLGHTITDLAPSLFTFKINSELLKDLSGITFSNVHLQLKTSNKDFEQAGPLLITHWGLSGPALLKLSAWAAREMKEDNYQAEIQINWLNQKREEIFKYLKNKTKLKRKINNTVIDSLPNRFWNQFLEFNKIDPNKSWNEISQKEINILTDSLYKTSLFVEGKSRFKEEFVECGGVNLAEIDFKTMQSKIVPRLFFAGEVLDIDGITGGFNFQNAWTGGWIAGSHF